MKFKYRFRIDKTEEGSWSISEKSIRTFWIWRVWCKYTILFINFRPRKFHSYDDAVDYIRREFVGRIIDEQWTYNTN